MSKLLGKNYIVECFQSVSQNYSDAPERLQDIKCHIAALTAERDQARARIEQLECCENYALEAARAEATLLAQESATLKAKLARVQEAAGEVITSVDSYVGDGFAEINNVNLEKIVALQSAIEPCDAIVVKGKATRRDDVFANIIRIVVEIGDKKTNKIVFQGEVVEAICNLFGGPKCPKEITCIFLKGTEE